MMIQTTSTFGLLKTPTVLSRITRWTYRDPVCRSRCWAWQSASTASYILWLYSRRHPVTSETCRQPRRLHTTAPTI